MQTCTIKATAHHRNGIGGNPFYIAIVRDKDAGGDMVVIFADKPCDEDGSEQPWASGMCEVYALSIDRLTERDIEFGSNSWRGDNYAHLYEDVKRMADQ